MPYQTQLTNLPGGLRVATCEMPQAETAAMGIWASVGGRHEPARLNGISHFIEHMLFKGTRRRSARRIMQEIEGVGGDMNAYTAEERTCYYATAAAEFFPRVCDVLCDIYLEPRLSKLDIERERSVIGEEILMYRDEPSSHVQELLNATFWPNHALGRPLTGTLESIESMGRDEFVNYRASHYHAGSTVVSAAGRVSHEDVVARVSKALAKLPRGRKPQAKKAPPVPDAPRMEVEARDIQQTQVALALPAFSHFDERRYAFQILNIILGGNASSRLFQELREKRGICYSVSSHPLTLDDSGVLNVSVGLDRKNLEKSLRLILTQFEALREKPVGAAELRRAKEYAIGTSRMSLERTSSQNMRVGVSVLVYDRIIEPDLAHERIRAVTADDVREVARAVLDPRRLTLALVGPNPDVSMLSRVLGV
ncbi:MAG: pitrilysin family protein [Terrimicrobiaceae bacterium]|nr:pitrilysin family protein [Terrimicrobiaceae bacterium]